MTNRCWPYVVVALLIVFPQLVARLTKAEEIDRDGIRIATFNVSLNRRNAGELAADLANRDNSQAKKIAKIIQTVRPDVLLLNEFDFDATGATIELFKDNYLEIAQGEAKIIRYEYGFAAPTNTGVASGHDLDNNGRVGGPGDAFGFGFFPGQYGMYVLSQFPIDTDKARTFQTFLWRDMPNSLLPTAATEPDYDKAEVDILRLSSKSHWDLPIQIGERTIHLLCSHPTPPVFDGPEDRNGRRNYDEIRFWADYIAPSKSGYIYDDKKKSGGLANDQHFVIAGDMNADPHDGDSSNRAINQLLSHPLVNASFVPTSAGAKTKSQQDGDINEQHKGNPAHDTSDFDDRRTGNLRLDYVLPSKSLRVVGSGVFWPTSDDGSSELIEASDHRLVWIDIEL